MKKATILAILILGILFGILVVTVHLRLWAAIDQAALLTLQSAVPRSLDFPFSVFSLIGSAELSIAICLLLVLLVEPNQRLPLLAAFFLIAAIELVCKTFFIQPTTPWQFRRYLFHLPLPSGEIHTPFSFPSGHVARTTFLVIWSAKLIALGKWGRSSRIIAFAALSLVELLMLVSRVYLAEHWLSDVLGGALLGGAMVLVSLTWKFDLSSEWLRQRL